MTGTPPRRQHQLPAEVSSFVGRRHEQVQVRRALAASRLVTLSGPGGVGKTRLALRVAADLARNDPDGVRIVELAPVQDPELVPDTVVAALGLRGATATPDEALVAHLRDRRLLLLLDNCEHLRDAAGALVRRVLHECPQVTILVTSRHALVVPGEHLLTVPALPVPPPGREAHSAQALRVYDSVRLFEERAASVWPPFEVTDENQGAVAELVRRLDGVPLAIELAAVRIRSLSVEQVLDRLRDRFALLSRGDRAASPRQRSLRALIDWSYHLLGPEEQALWERASVFAGSFDLTDLAGVVVDDALGPDQLEELVQSLVRKSLLVAEPAALGPRWHQLESIKEYGLARLAEAGRLARLRRRHVAHYRSQALTAAREMFGRGGVSWFGRLCAEHDDLRAALEWCAAEGGPAEDGPALMGALQHYWVMTGRFAEGRHWAGRLLARTPATGGRRAPLLVVAGRLAVLQGDVGEGRALLEQGLSKATLLGGSTWRAHALHGLALAALFWEEPAAARTLLEEALALHRTGEDPFGVPLALIQLATLHATLGETERAVQYAEECIGLSAHSGEQWCAAMARWTEALVAWRNGRTDLVRSYAREVLRLKEPFGDRLGMAMCLEVLAWSSAAEHRYDEAARLVGAVGSALDSVGGGLFRTLRGGHEACVARTRAELGEAQFERLVSEGAALPFEDAVVLALARRRDPARGPARSRAAPTARLPRLTRRESEVARLVAEGLTDREIAAQLVLAQRTAEGHVKRALSKLGLTSRHQLAGWVAEQRSRV
jgi:predicted ATPase/DNA-binding CsgD family transcriptional regulator